MKKCGSIGVVVSLIASILAVQAAAVLPAAAADEYEAAVLASDPVAFWPVDEPTGPYPDQLAVSSDLTLVAGAATSIPALTPRSTGSAIDVTEGSQLVATGSFGVVDQGDGATVEFWFRGGLPTMHLVGGDPGFATQELVLEPNQAGGGFELRSFGPQYFWTLNAPANIVPGEPNYLAMVVDDDRHLCLTINDDVTCVPDGGLFDFPPEPYHTLTMTAGDGGTAFDNIAAYDRALPVNTQLSHLYGAVPSLQPINPRIFVPAEFPVPGNAQIVVEITNPTVETINNVAARLDLPAAIEHVGPATQMLAASLEPGETSVGVFDVMTTSSSPFGQQTIEVTTIVDGVERGDRNGVVNLGGTADTTVVMDLPDQINALGSFTVPVTITNDSALTLGTVASPPTLRLVGVGNTLYPAARIDLPEPLDPGETVMIEFPGLRAREVGVITTATVNAYVEVNAITVGQATGTLDVFPLVPVGWESTVAADNPVHWWSLGDPAPDPGENAIAVDSAGSLNGLVGAFVLQGAPHPFHDQGNIPDDQFDTSMFFSGSPGAFIDLGAGDLSGRSDQTFSVEAWIRPHKTGELMSIIDTGVGGFELEVLPSGHVRGAIVTGVLHGDPVELEVVSDEIVAETDVWHHVVLSRNGSRLQLWVDGILSTEIETTATIHYPGGGFSDIGENFRGEIDEVVYYDFPLEQPNVVAHHTSAGWEYIETFFGKLAGEELSQVEQIADPVNSSTGAFVEHVVDVEFPPSVFGLAFARNYDSKLVDGRDALGGWEIGTVGRIETYGGGLVAVWSPGGTAAVFHPDGLGGYASDGLADLTLDATASGWTTRMNSGVESDFDIAGREVERRNWDGQSVTFAYSGGGELTSATSSTGRSLTLSYTNGQITAVTADDGRSYSYGYDAEGDLATVTDANGDSMTYTTDAVGRITQIFDEDGRTVVISAYDADGRVVEQFDGAGNRSTFVYGDNDGTLIVNDEASNTSMLYRHDRRGRLESITDPNGEVATRSYNEAGEFAGGTDRLGRSFSITYDDRDNPTAVVAPDGTIDSFVYDSADRVTAYTDSNGETWTYTYAGDERIPSTFTNPDGAVTTAVIANGLASSVTDADGITTTFTYTADRQLASRTDADGATTTFTYDATGQLTGTTSALGHTTTFAYDAEGQLVSITDALGGVTSWTYDAAGNLLSETDTTGAVTSWTYDERGLRETMTDALGRVTTWTYDTAGWITEITRPGGATTTFQRDEFGRIISETDPTGVVTTSSYDTDGRLTATSTTAGSTGHAYDDRDRPTSFTDETGATTSTTYDDLGNPATTTNANGEVTSTTYDGTGRVSSRTFADGGTETTSYTAAGRLLTTTDARGAVTTRTYDDVGRLETVTDAIGATTTYTYDLDGRITSMTSAEGLATAYEYDALGRRTAIVNPAGQRFETSYTSRGEVSSQTDATGAITGFVYDGVGNLIAATDPLGGVATYGYDVRDNRTSRTDADGHTWTWTYDLADRMLSEVDPLGQAMTYTYDDVGRMATMTDASGRSETYTYDAASRLLSTTYGDGSVVAHTYDPVGRRTSMADALGTTTFGYDAVGRLASVVEASGETQIYTYDTDGELTSITHPDGTIETHTRDDLGRLASVSIDGSEITHEYDLDGRLVATRLDGSVVRTFGYTDHLLTSYSDAELGSVTIGHDANSRVTSITGAESWTFGYDPAGQLTSASDGSRSWAYSYDGRGNVTQIADSVDGTTTFVHDAAGNLTGGTDAAGALAFVSDEMGRLVEFVAGDGASTSWVYDARGLPTTVTLTTPGDEERPIEPTDPCSSLTPTITGTAADDLIWGTSGDDIIFAGAGHDLVLAGGGDDIICGGDGDDDIYASNGADQVFGQSGHDSVNAGSGDDIVVGGPGLDWIEGCSGNDALFGSNGGDVIFGDGGHDLLDGGNGLDDLLGGAGNDDLWGGAGSDWIEGGGGDDHARGEAGTDYLFGRGGDDVLIGGDGTDSVRGNNGTDACDGETVFSCESMATGGTGTPAATVVQTRTYDGDGILLQVDRAAATGPTSVEMTWLRVGGVPQIGQWSIDGATTAHVYGPTGRDVSSDGTVAAVGRSTLGHALGGSIAPFGVDLTEPVGFGLESELTLDGITHLRARDLDPTLGRFTTRDPLDGIDATPTVANRFHYAGNDPVNASDPLGLFVVTDKGLVLSGYCDGAELFGADIGCAAAAMAQPIADFHAGVLHTLVSSVTFGVADSRSVLGLFNAEDQVDYSSRYFMAGQLIASVVEIGTGAAGAIKAVNAARNAIRTRSLARAGNALDDNAARHIDNIANEGRVVSHACSFSGDTGVLLADGTTKPINQIEPGDWVLAHDPETGDRGARRVTHIWIHNDTLTNLHINGDLITTTEDHPFWNHTDHEWQRADQLDPGDHLLTAQGQLLNVEHFETTRETGTAYNLTIEHIHTYYVETGDQTVLVHNTGPDSDACPIGWLDDIRPDRLTHIRNRHIRGGSEWDPLTSYFNDPDEIVDLTRAAENWTPMTQAQNGNVVVVVDAGRDIGWDAATNAQTRLYTVIVRPGEGAWTAHPGLPRVSP